MEIGIISKVMIKFRSKFQFQIPLHFCRAVKKIKNCDVNGQKLGQGPPFFQLSRFGYYFVFFMIEIQAY